MRVPVAGAVLALVLAVALVALTAESITAVHLLLALALGATVGLGLWLVMRSQPKAGSSLPNFSADADRADAALHAALGTWREVLDSIPEFSSVKDVSPDSVPGLLSGARTYLGIRRECTRTAELLDGYRAQIRQWEDDVRSATAAAAPTLSASLPDPTDAIQALHDIAETTHENFRTAESHKRQLASLEARLSLAESRCADAERLISSLAKHYGLEPGAVDQVLTARLGALTQEVQTLHDTRSELVAERASLRAKQDQYEQDASVEQLEAELDALSGELAALVEADAIAELARSILSGASQQYEKESTPTIMRLTSEVLGALTDGALNHVELLTTNAGRVLSVSGSRGSGLTIMELSDGERDQLYLAFRIGVLLSLDDIGPDLPVLLDDVILTYDAERRERACAAIAELAKHRQVLFFTSQDSIKECLEAHGRDAGVSTHTIALQVS